METGVFCLWEYHEAVYGEIVDEYNNGFAPTLPFNRQYLSYDACLGVNREDNHNVALHFHRNK